MCAPVFFTPIVFFRFSVIDFTLKLIVKNSKEAKKLYFYEPVTKWDLFQDLLFSVPYFYVYALKFTEIDMFYSVAESVLLIVNFLRIIKLYSYYSKHNLLDYLYSVKIVVNIIFTAGPCYPWGTHS